MTPRPPFRVTLPWAVVCPDNQRHGLLQRGRGGPKRIGLTGKYRRALEYASMAAMAGKMGYEPFSDPVVLTIMLHEPNYRRRDLGNFVKLISDALQGSAYHDDHQIHDLHVLRGTYDKSRPRADIEVKPLILPPK